MEKRNTLLLTVIAIATLLVAVVGATFAYFATTQDVNANIPVNIQTASAAASFTATSDGGIDIMVDAFEMQQADADDENQSIDANLAAGLTDESNLTVKLNAAAAGEQSTCKYSIIYTWTSEKYTPEGATEAKYYHPTADVAKEFTIQGAGTISGTTTTGTTNQAVAETNMSSFELKQKQVTTAEGTKTVDYFILVPDATIVSDSTDTATEVQWNFKVKFYNSTKDQSLLMGKTFSGTISVDPDSVEC